MKLIFITPILFALLLALSPKADANVSIDTATSVVATEDANSESDETTLAQDNSSILANSGMSIMFAVWSMSPSEYCASKVLFNSKHNRKSCKLKIL